MGVTSRRLFVHVGPAKSGTSAVQHFFHSGDSVPVICDIRLLRKSSERFGQPLTQLLYRLEGPHPEPISLRVLD
jgi:hypothetical protein